MNFVFKNRDFSLDVSELVGEPSHPGADLAVRTLIKVRARSEAADLYLTQ